jgi:hypothetical protein
MLPKILLWNLSHLSPTQKAEQKKILSRKELWILNIHTTNLICIVRKCATTSTAVKPRLNSIMLQTLHSTKIVQDHHLGCSTRRTKRIDSLQGVHEGPTRRSTGQTSSLVMGVRTTQQSMSLGQQFKAALMVVCWRRESFTLETQINCYLTVHEALNLLW